MGVCRKTLRAGLSLFVRAARFLLFRCGQTTMMDGNDSSHLGAVTQNLNGMCNEGLWGDLLNRVLIINRYDDPVIADCRIGWIQPSVCASRLEQRLSSVGESTTTGIVARARQDDCIAGVARGSPRNPSNRSHLDQACDVPACGTRRALADLGVILWCNPACDSIRSAPKHNIKRLLLTRIELAVKQHPKLTRYQRAILTRL